MFGTQFETSLNYEQFKKIAIERDIKVITLEADKKISIEANINLDILWPDTQTKITQNVLNNNSLVFQLTYKNNSILFTGDIEEIAERAILQKYFKNKEILKSNIIKVAHHGSKTSSTEEFLQAVNPQIALIGVRQK